MASLLDHFLPTAGDSGFPEKIAVHTFEAALNDYARGFTTRNEIINFWDLTDTQETDQLDTLLAFIDAQPGLPNKTIKLYDIGKVLTIVESGEKYQTGTELAERLGL